MSTKWKYATIPAQMRLEMLAGGNEELYKEEIARTKDAISARLASGLDVSEQMKWADTVSYNYNLGKASALGIDASNVSKDGYSGRLFGDMTESVGKNTSTVTEPKKITPENPYYKEPYGRSSESLHQSVIDSYIKAINERGSILQDQAKDYIKSIEDDYQKKLAEVKKAYEKKNKNLDEALLNQGVSQNGGRVLSEEIRMEDEYRDLLKSLQEEKNKLISDIRNSLKEDLYSLSGEMMSKASDEYYRYNSLLADEKNAQYQKERDAVSDEKWRADFDYQKEKDRLLYEERMKNSEYEKEKDSYNRSLTEREFEMREKQNAQEYEMWLAELEKDKKNDDRKHALEREKFEYSKEESAKKNENKSETETETGEKFGEVYESCLKFAKDAKAKVVLNEIEDRYELKYTKEDLLKMVYGFALSDEEKKSICFEIGLYS